MQQFLIREKHKRLKSSNKKLTIVEFSQPFCQCFELLNKRKYSFAKEKAWLINISIQKTWPDSPPTTVLQNVAVPKSQTLPQLLRRVTNTRPYSQECDIMWHHLKLLYRTPTSPYPKNKS